jgi:hypothetical protein
MTSIAALDAVSDEYGPVIILAFMPAATPETYATAIILDRQGRFHEVHLETIAIRPVVPSAPAEPEP